MLGSVLLLLSPHLSFLLLSLDPLQPLLIHTQLSLLSFGSMIWRWLQNFKGWSTELIITCSTSALLFAISRHASTRATVGTLGLFPERPRTTPSYIGSPIWHLSTSFSSFQGTSSSWRSRISGRVTPFLLMKKRGERFYRVILGVFIYVLSFYLWTCSIWWTCFIWDM